MASDPPGVDRGASCGCGYDDGRRWCSVLGKQSSPYSVPLPPCCYIKSTLYSGFLFFVYSLPA